MGFASPEKGGHALELAQAYSALLPVTGVLESYAAGDAVPEHAQRPRRATRNATKKPARMKNTGIRKAWMNIRTKSASGVVCESRHGRGD